MTLESPHQEVDGARAFALVARSRHKINSMVRRRSADPGLFDEVFQVTTITVWKKWETVSAHPSPDGYVMVVARHVLNRMLSEESRYRRIVAKIDDPEPLPSPEPLVCDTIPIRDMVKALPQRQRQAIILFYFMQYKETEIAEAMGITVGAVKAMLNQARSNLRRNYSST